MVIERKLLFVHTLLVQRESNEVTDVTGSGLICDVPISNVLLCFLQDQIITDSETLGK